MNLRLIMAMLATAMIFTRQDKPAPKPEAPKEAACCQISEVDSLHVEVATKDYQIASQPCQNDANRAIANLNGVVNGIKSAHGWGADVQYNFDTKRFEKRAVTPAPEKK